MTCQTFIMRTCPLLTTGYKGNHELLPEEQL